MYELRIKVKGLPKNTNQQNNNNWRAAYAEKKKWKERVIAHCLGLEPQQPLMQARVHCIRHSSRQGDFDGLVSSFKHCIDALVLSGIIIDDKPSVIGVPTYEWKRAPQKQGYIELIVTE